MGFGQAISSVLGKYATFGGRASRSEFWWWALFAFLVEAAASVLDSTVLKTGASGNNGLASGLVGLALFLPGLAVQVRRLHDVDRSGWWYLLAFTVIGLIPLLIWAVQRGTAGDNRFGPDPLATAGLGAPDGFAPLHGGAPASFNQTRVP